MKIISLTSLFLLVCMIQLASGQQLSYSDPAIAYQRILLEKSGEGTYQVIGSFKVKGTSMLYGGNQTGSVYAKSEKADMATISYNTYNQQLNILQAGQSKEISMTLNEVDSFTMLLKSEKGKVEALRFINGNLIDPGKKAFLQIVCSGPKFTMYKQYTSTMGIVSTNYVQSELRQFDLIVDYYYTEAGNPGLKKLKNNARAVKAELGKYKNLDAVLANSDYNQHPEAYICDAIQYLNQ